MRNVNVKTIISKIASVEVNAVTDDSKLEDDLLMDQLDLADLAITLEDDFEIDLNSGVENTWNTVKDVETCIQTLLGR